ncbi:MAG TPA: amidohydrolase family protein [Chloroflexota bacterium]|nr:amidohydrolase family protein [Chloroflexota bacterium]
MAIDLHCHIFPPEYLRLARTDGARIGARIYRRDDGQEFIQAPGDFNYPLTDDLWSVPALVEALGQRHLTGAALSVAPPTLSYWAEAGLAADISAASNDSIAAVVHESPDRFVGLATVPFQDIPRAIAELERAMKRPEFRGVMIASHVGEKNLNHPDLFPFFEACQQLDACVFIHPYEVLGTERLQDYYLWNLIGMVTETCVAIASLIFGGVYDRLPRLKTYFAHAGGSYPWLRGRAEHGYHVLKNTRFDVDRPPSAYLDRIYVDNMIYVPSALTWLAGEIGSDHIAVGSDYPFDIGPADPTAIVREAPGLTDADRENILRRTAWQLLGVEIGAG